MGSKKILITGVSGLIGQILSRSLKSIYDVAGVDLIVSSEVPTSIVDATKLEDLATAFSDVDTVIDLAGNPNQFSPWSVVRDNNLNCTYNTFEAAKLGGVRKVIYASSNHVTGMYEVDPPYSDIVQGLYKTMDPNDVPLITTSMPVRPDGPYGMGKLFGESVGRYFSDKFGMSVCCLRIGTVNKEDRPIQIRQFATLLAHQDLIQLVNLCIQSDHDPAFSVYYGVSNNRWRFWDIENAERDLGYSPVVDAETWRDGFN